MQQRVPERIALTKKNKGKTKQDLQKAIKRVIGNRATKSKKKKGLTNTRLG